MDNLLLSDTFLNLNTNSNVTVDLYDSYINIYNNNDDDDDLNQKMMINDLAGYFIEKPFANKDLSVGLVLNFYPKFKKYKSLRKRLSIDLKYSKCKHLNDNLKKINEWKKALNSIIHANNQSIKPFLVFLNPNSGSGKASKLWLNNILKVWNEANLSNNDLIITEYKDHAKNYIKTAADLKKYKGIVVVSGDGLVHEIINGLMERNDWSTAIQTPISQIGAGSGNAFSTSISFLSNETYQDVSLEKLATSMAFLMLKSKPEPLDLIKVQLANKQIIHSFLNIEWCIVADVDLESENYRYFGGLRFFIGMIKRIINFRTYRGRVSFLPEDLNYKPKNSNFQIICNKNNYKDNNNSQIKSNLDFNYLTPLNEPVPNDWITIEDNFSFFLIINLPFLASDLFVTPDSKNDDGIMYLVFIRDDVSRLEILKGFTDGTSGNFLKNPCIEFVRCKAFRLEPMKCLQTNKVEGTLMVDGELIEYGPIQGEIKPKLARVLLNK